MPAAAAETIDERSDRLEAFVAELLAARAKAGTWRTQAACRGLDSELFFQTPRRGEDVADTYADAVEVCRGCAVRLDCEHEGRGEREGVWGGVTPTERASERRRAYRRRAS